MKELKFTPATERLLLLADKFRRRSRMPYLGREHVFAALIAYEGGLAHGFIQQHGITKKEFEKFCGFPLFPKTTKRKKPHS